MAAKDRERILEHIHGLFAGSLAVVALFVLSTVPIAVAWFLQGQVDAGALVYPVVFLGFLWATVREARLWHRYLTAAGSDAAGA